jgi:DNA polymerase-3 subunit chi
VTEVAFHFGAPDKVAYVCRLLRKAVGSGAKVVVLADAETVQSIDSELWALSPVDFVGHCVGTATSTMKEISSVVLVTEIQQALANRQVLVNLTESVPDEFDTFDRLIEVVSVDETDRNHARQRWKNYTDRGYSIARHDLTLRGAS